jgi:sulfur-oxidizing protein SoxA
LSWETLGSVQRRFRECNSQIRAEPEPYGSDDYIALELYVASRGQGLPVESPSVRK